MKYDDASWHSGGDFPAESPMQYGGTHIALFMKWCFVKGWAGDMHLKYAPEDTASVISSELSATKFFFKYCDGKLTDEDFNETGNQFAKDYYGEDGLYLIDYATQFEKLMYSASDADHDFAKFATMLNARFENGILQQGQMKPKAWWRFW